MTIQVGDKIPEGMFTVMGAEGPTGLSTGDLFAGKKVVLFAVPGAFTPTCSAAHLPGFVVLPRASYPQGGSSNWSNGFLPADFQGTPLRPEGSPILDLNLPTGMTKRDQRSNLDLLAKLNDRHFKVRSEQDELNARMS